MVSSQPGTSPASVSSRPRGFNAGGSALLFSSFLGGSSADYGNAIAADRDSNAVVVGQRASSNFPTLNPLEGTLSGSTDGFVSRGIGSPYAELTTISTDSGASSTDEITNDPTLHLYGLATPNATVTLYRAGLGGSIASFAASAAGTWSYDYTATSLSDGVYNFAVRATSGGVTSTFSDPFRVTVDTANPLVTLTMDGTTSSFSPFVRVTAADYLAGLGSSTTVTLDIDTDNNGSWDSSDLYNYLASFRRMPKQDLRRVERRAVGSPGSVGSGVKLRRTVARERWKCGAVQIAESAQHRTLR